MGGYSKGMGGYPKGMGGYSKGMGGYPSGMGGAGRGGMHHLPPRPGGDPVALPLGYGRSQGVC